MFLPCSGCTVSIGASSGREWAGPAVLDRRNGSGVSSLCPGQEDGAAFRSGFFADARQEQWLLSRQLLGWMAPSSEQGLSWLWALCHVQLPSERLELSSPLQGHPCSLEIRLWQKGAAALVISMWHKGLFSAAWPFHGLWGFSV